MTPKLSTIKEFEHYYYQGKLYIRASGWFGSMDANHKIIDQDSCEFMVRDCGCVPMDTRKGTAMFRKANKDDLNETHKIRSPQERYGWLSMFSIRGDNGSFVKVS